MKVTEAGKKRAEASVRAWFASQDWKVFKFQRDTWHAYLNGESGLLHVPTGMGKTYAAWFGPVIEYMAEMGWTRSANLPIGSGKRAAEPLRVLWITPLRALASTTEQALRRPIEDLDLPWTVERRTGDISASTRSRQNKRLPTALITTPESLSLLLSREDAREIFSSLRAIVVDEWHELLGNKRGTQTDLCLGRLRHWTPEVRTWGMAATMGNPDEALRALLGSRGSEAADREMGALGRHIRGLMPKKLRIDTLLPDSMDKFPWSGHLGMRMLPQVVRAIEEHRSTLIFTNTRSQTENWFQLLLEARPEWEGRIALHHGSLDGAQRAVVEERLSAGELRAVVCTSSLDLGVDFTPVERVLQIGSPKGIARLIQRAGRSGHQPGATSRITCVPTNAFELVEAAAVREAAEAKDIEARRMPVNPVDVLVQHVVTVALGGGFREEELLQELRRSHTYRDLTMDELQWVLDFVTWGGKTLKGHPEYHRLRIEDGTFHVRDKQIALRHRLSIGTITSDGVLRVQVLGGATLGTIEENFLARMRPGDTFVFAGNALELVRIHDMTAQVRRAKSKNNAIPRWMGGRMPLSTELAAAVRRKLDEARQGLYIGPEMQSVREVLELQAEWSAIPGLDEVLVEQFKTREGHHLAIYPFAGRLVHEGLAALIAYRLAQSEPISFAFTANDYGFELVSASPAPFTHARAPQLFSLERLVEDIQASVNLAELARRQFRPIARIAGLIFPGYPGARKQVRQFQASSGLFYDVFARLEPDNLLLQQARYEVLEHQFEQRRLEATLARIGAAQLILMQPENPTPLAFPLMVDSMRARLTTERASDRIQKMRVRLEKAASA